MKKEKSFSLVRRLIGIVLISFFFLLSVQTISTLWGRNLVTREMYSSAHNNVRYLQKSFEDNLKSIRTGMSQRLFVQEDAQLINFYIRLRRDSFASPAHYQWTLNQLKSDLNVARQMNPLIDRMDVYFPRLHLCLQSGNSATGNSVTIRTASDEETTQLYRAFQNQAPLLAWAGDGFYVPCYYPNTVSRTDAGHILAAVHINETKIQELLSVLNTYSGKNALLYHHDSGVCITSRNSISPPENALSQLLQNTAGQEESCRIEIDGSTYIALRTYSEVLHCSFIQLIQAQQLNAVPDMLLKGLLLFSAAMLAVVLLILKSFHRYVKRPVQTLTAAFEAAGSGVLHIRVNTQDCAGEFRILADGFNEMVVQLGELIDTNYRQTIMLQQAQLKTLQAQINPHFLYNSFFFLRTMLENEETETAAEFTGYLGKYYRYITKSSDDLVTLEEEYDHAITYLHIQLMRFGETVSAQADSIPEDMKARPVPRLILQPLLENCIEHGMAAEKMQIRISLIPDGSLLCIQVENSGEDFTPSALQTLQDRLENAGDDCHTSGLTNVHRRLRLYYGSACGVELSKSALGGLRAVLKIGVIDHAV